MDPNAENGPPKVEVAEVDVEFDLKDHLKAPPPVITPPLASSLFATAMGAAQEDPAEIQARHEAEFQRRLRGEREETQARVSEVVYGNMNTPMRLTSIRLSPAPPTTRTRFLDGLLAPFMGDTGLPDWMHPTPRSPQTLHEILLSTKALVAHIDKVDVFDMERVGIRLEPAPSGEPDEVELVLALRERGRYFLKAGTEMGSNEGGGNITGRIRNVFGGGETLEVNASVGTKTRSAYQGTLATPVFSSPYLSFAVSGFSQDRDNTAFASHRELQQGARLKLAAVSPYGVHDLAYEYIQRDIGHLTPTASASIRELAFPTTKASLVHTWTSDTRDDLWMATSGRLLKATHEYAGLPGSSELAHFLKSTTQSQASRPLYDGSGIIVSVASFTSILYPLWSSSGAQTNGSPRATYLPDRTYLGGPNSVRGFKVGGLGLSDRVDSLGGDLAYGLGVSALLPIPKKEHWPLKIHSFMNIGKVVQYDQTRSFADNVAKVASNPSLSVGLGLMYRFDPLRIELNFSMPIIARKGERLARGFSVGIGIDFL